MKLRQVVATAAAALLCSPLGLSHAQTVSPFDFLRVEFRDRVGAGTPTQSFDVWLRVTNTGTDPFVFDGNDAAGFFGLPEDRLPQTGSPDIGPDQNFGSYTNAFLTVFVDCGGNFFTVACPGDPYDFSFNFDDPSFAFRESFSLGGGAIYDFLLGTLFPAGGSAPPDEYRLFNAGFELIVNGVAEDGVTPLQALFEPDVETCADQNPDCHFVRVTMEVGAVEVVPEPATFALLGAGMGALLLATRRRRS